MIKMMTNKIRLKIQMKKIIKYQQIIKHLKTQLIPPK